MKTTLSDASHIGHNRKIKEYLPRKKVTPRQATAPARTRKFM